MTNTLYIEPYSGIAGDMFVAAISELVTDHKPLLEALGSLPVSDEFTINLESANKNGIKAKRFNVKLTDNNSSQDHSRTLEDIVQIIEAADRITPNAKNLAVNIFKNLAKAEATVHGTTYSAVHFHEVGAIDAIIDIVSAAILLDGLDVTEIISAPISLGQGTMKSAHGIIPIPSPATVELIKGVPVNKTTIETELTTPTGAAIITTITNKWNSRCSGILVKSGYGAGSKEIKELSNSIRVSLFKTEEKCIDNSEEIIVIECNLDDYPAEHLSFLGPHLLKNGALDFTIIPAAMKKGRQGIIIQVLCPTVETQNIASLLLKETTTLGIRYRKEKRIVLGRKCRIIETPLGKLNIKLGINAEGKTIKAKPEQSSVEKITEQQNKSYFETYKQLDYYTQNWLQKHRKS